jgi:2',3'-cyclic-nucleotide 2'-phosphodiesterase (5'-nucleotidase family)
MPLRILHTNDLHGKLSPEIESSLAKLRKECDFYFDSGDAVAAGNLGICRNPDPVWDAFARLNCTAGGCGNREFHISESGFRSKLKGCRHPILAANLDWNGKPRKPLLDFASDTPLPTYLKIDRVGIVGVMVPMVTRRMAARHVSAFINTDPIGAAASAAGQFRNECDLMICISHLGLQRDRLLAERAPYFDIILGGHSHDALPEPQRVGGSWICQGGSHAKYCGVYVWDGGRLTGGLVPLR